ncbi:uncharacterized protein TRIADDRAFT_61941 [Trichoplax adhaerens]|uniref:Uncharacterized protein n=1 Tax=Trichoplax adhaerens TaxID=10228 RepID=B3SCE2_TRIAD|nr:predicted protein [Trichoplax adhaerens]EDV19575.1 predicted protein [Trichoplax adhaerens]|eukprot:XP_002117908.1 predicted protein [Trichoplax adhaerens]
MDFNLSISNPAFGQCRIIGTENCWKKNCQIVIKDYETLDLVLRISPPEISIESIEIAADGCTVAFKDVMETWIIYNIDKNERMNFVENDEQEDADDRFYSLQFFTMKCENSLIMTLNQNRLGLRIWKIENDQILPTIKQISSKYQIESCRWIMAPNRKQILLWYRKFDYNGDPKHRPKDRQNWINESQIELWDLETWSIQRSLKMPAFVFRNAGGYIATNDFEHGLSLYCINYINRNTEFIISAYGRFGLDDGTMGLIKLEDDINASQNLIEFSNRFQIILHENQYIKNISVSDDHQFIAIDFSREDVGEYELLTSGNYQFYTYLLQVLVLRIIEDQVRYYAKVKPSVISKSIFIPGKNRLLVHDYWDKHCLYEYNLQGHNIHWQDIQDSNSNLKYIALKDGTKTTVKVLDVCMAYVNSIPVVAVLNLDINDSYQLEVAYFLDADHVEEPRELLNYSIPKECVGSYKITSRHRKTDNVLIFIIHSEICLEEYGMLIIIITINLKTGKKIIYEQDDMYRHISQIYADDCYLYTYQEKDTLDKENLCNVKCYKFGDGKQQTQLIKTYPYDVQNGSVFKISVDSNQLVYSPVITYSRKYKKKDLFIEIYGETKADAIVNHWYSSYIIFLLENGDHAAILNKHGEVIMKMYKNSKIKVDPEAIIFNNENLWSNKHFLAYYRSLSSLHFYDSKTLQLQMTLPFPHFEIMDMQWNCQKSSFIVSNRCDNYYCFIKRIE